MKIKTANRWLNRNKWKIAQWKLEDCPFNDFYKQMIKMKRIVDIRYRRFDEACLNKNSI